MHCIKMPDNTVWKRNHQTYTADDLVLPLQQSANLSLPLGCPAIASPCLIS